MGDDHRCEHRDRVEALEAELRDVREQFAAMQGTLAKLQRHAFGQRSEKIPPIATELRDPERAERERISALQKRRENQEKRRNLTTRRIEHQVPEDRKVCPKCGGHDLTKLGGCLVTELSDGDAHRPFRPVPIAFGVEPCLEARHHVSAGGLAQLEMLGRAENVAIEGVALDPIQPEDEFHRLPRRLRRGGLCLAETATYVGEARCSPAPAWQRHLVVADVLVGEELPDRAGQDALRRLARAVGRVDVGDEILLGLIVPDEAPKPGRPRLLRRPDAMSGSSARTISIFEITSTSRS